MLDSLLQEVVTLVGAVCADLEQSYLRGRESATPPKVVHGLAQSICGVKATVRALRNGRPTIDLAAVSHLFAVREIFKRWEPDPQWPVLRAGLENPDSYRHTICLLAAGGVLVDVGNDFRLLAERSEFRTPDAFIGLGRSGGVSVEVKSPQTLDTIQRPLSSDQAGRIVKRALRSAGSGAGGQLAQGEGSLLILGGLHLSQADFEILTAATRGHLRDHRAPRPRLLGVVVVSVGTVVEGNLLAREGRLLGGSATSLAATLSVEVVENPRYEGPHGMDTNRQPGVSYLDEDVVEEWALESPPHTLGG